MATIHQMNRGLGTSGAGPLLTIGAVGDAVKTLQQQLNKLRVTFIAIREDGIYSNDTANAVKAFQGKNNLSVTGAVDSATRDALVAAISAATVAGTTSLVAAQPAQPSPPKFALWQLGLMVFGGLAMVGGALWLVTKKNGDEGEPTEPMEPMEPEPASGDGPTSGHTAPVKTPSKVRSIAALAKCARTPGVKQLAAGELLLPPP